MLATVMPIQNSARHLAAMSEKRFTQKRTSGFVRRSRLMRCFSVLLFVSMLALAAITAQAAGKRLTVELVSTPGAIVSPGIARVQWRPGADEISYIRPEGSRGSPAPALYIYDVASGHERVLFQPSGETADFTLSSYQWSPKGDLILFARDNDLWIYDVRSGHTRRLTHDREEEEVPAFSPTGERVAFVKKNDLYTVELASDRVTRLTHDGSATVYNGILDWVYQEELAYRSAGRAYEWSPDGKLIAYLRLDDGLVPQYPITSYLSTHVGLTEQRFPQAGDPNPRPSLHVVKSGEEQQPGWNFPLPANVEYLSPSFTWTPDSQAVSILTLNRHENELNVHEWEPMKGNDRVVVTEKDPFWINSLDAPHFLNDGRRFLWLSERDGWLHLYLFAQDGKLLRKLTSGDWMIDHPIFSDVPMFQVDESSGWVYFPSTDPDPRERQLWRVRLEGGAPERVTRETGSHALNLSPDGHYLIDTFSDILTPTETRLLTPDGTLVAILDKPENHLSDYALAKTELLEVKGRDGATLYARLLKPHDFDPGRKYPVVVFIYGGPHEQLVKHEWHSYSLVDHLFAQEGFLVWTLDNRGSWGRGHKWESSIFEHLGQHELEDQLAGIDYLKSLPYVDASRIGIRGWSYGGYMTLYALTHAPDVFKCGAAGGPVTDWKFYDSIYTERYMRKPEENPEGYKDASPLQAAANLRGKVLLIHGADDDNVHMQNTFNFIDALIMAGHPFELYIQPGQKHGFNGQAVITYLNGRLLDFFKRNL
jgi:dipeptidyl-peptidase 4